jgi:hypothetical protein
MGEFTNHVRDFMANWRDSEMPVPRRTLRTARNLMERMKGKDCCGHLGEPGC